MRIIQHLWDFVCGTWAALLFAAVSFVDPLKALKDVGVNLGYAWTITPDERRALFMALAFLWMAQWYVRLRLRHQDRQPEEPNMPLYLACRWIARDSVWAEKYHPSWDQDWAIRVDEELFGKIMQGRIEIFGRRHRRGSPTGPMQHIAPAYKSEAQWDSSKLKTDEPPTHMWAQGGDSYYNVCLDEARVKQIWPRRSWLARLRRRSPVERIGGKNYSGTFPAQDIYYREKEPVVLNAFEQLFGKANNG